MLEEGSHMRLGVVITTRDPVAMSGTCHFFLGQKGDPREVTNHPVHFEDYREEAGQCGSGALAIVPREPQSHSDILSPGSFPRRAGFQEVPHASVSARVCACVQVYQGMGACCMHVGVCMFVGGRSAAVSALAAGCGD